MINHYSSKSFSDMDTFIEMTNAVNYGLESNNVVNVK